MAFTAAHVSDTHLGAGTTMFRANFGRVRVALDTIGPELIVATGDVSLDGADSEADIAYAAQAFRRLPGKLHAVPGNHDVGDHPDRAPRQPVNDARLERFRRHFGWDRWVADHANWRLLGLNSQVMGAHGEADDQAAMIGDALETLGERRLAVFIHKPFFLAGPDDTLFDYWSVPPFARAPLLPVMAHPALRLVASGHTHLHHAAMRGRANYVWGPAVSFVVDPADQAGLPGERPCGILLHRFGDDDVETTLLVPEGMERPFFPDAQAEP